MNIQDLITLIVVLFIIGYALYLTIMKKWVELREFAYALMLQAERLYKDNQGKEKFEVVFREVYDLIPVWLQKLIPPKSIREKLQEWYDLAKDYLDDGFINRTPG